MKIEKLREICLEKLKRLQFNDDPEWGHIRADEALVDFLAAIGELSIVEAYEEIQPKWYA